MTLKRLSTFAFRLLLVAMAVALVVGATWLAVRQADWRLRSNFLQQARIVAKSLDPNRVATLTGTAADLASPDYRRLKQQLLDITSANEQIRFTYLMGCRPDGMIIFLVDSEPPDSADYSSPGQTYDEATVGIHAVFTTRQEAVEGPSSDRWGTFVSAFVPLTGLELGGAPIILGLDIDAKDWNRSLVARAALPAILAVFAALFGLLAALFYRSRREIRQWNDKLRESEQSYRNQFASNSSVMLLIDPADGAILDANAAALGFYGYPRERLLAMRITDINCLPPAEVRQAMASVSQNQGKQFEFQHRLANGSVREVEVSTSHIQFGQRNVLHSIIHDITERKQKDKQIHQLLTESDQARLALLSILEDQRRTEADRQRLAAAIEQAAEVIVVTDTQGQIQYVNPAFEAATGYTRAEAIGQNPRILKSGQQDQAFYQAMWETLRSGKTWRGRFVNKRKNGSLFTEDAVISPVCDPAGRLVSFVAVKHDITEHLRLAAQLQQALKMESVGRLAGGVAHDFNNILTVILGQAELALEQVDAAQPIHAALEEIRKAAERSTNLTRQLLAFARKQTIAPKIVDLNQTIAGILRMLQRLIGEDINLAWRPQADLWLVKADSAQIDQILINLCLNARDAIVGGGRITIETGNTIFDPASLIDRSESVPGEFVLLSVSDTGCGMDRETQDHIFEPFFTTKGIGEGTGLGLAMVYGIVKQNKGFINVYSEPGKGTTFRIYLPRHAGMAEPVRPEAPAPPPARGHETLLLVEDDPAILNMTRRMLEQQGYTVLATGTPGEAIRLAREHEKMIHLLMTDVVMPEMNGRDLAQKLLALRPQIKQLFMSGYTAEIIAHNGVLEEGVQFIQKPFSIQNLAAKIREALDSGGN